MDASSPPDRRTLVASIRDYVEQLREEGMEGLPAPVTSATRAMPPSLMPTATKAEAVPVSTELFSKYPGLEKSTTLDELRRFIGDCQRCKLAPRRINLVFGVGNPNAQLMFVGEAPGADEDARGEPFVGRAGQLLTDIIERGMGIS
ncbi:MAG: uracil-DNA glycosylase family protein, partial [Candidatus Binatus sp.]